MNFRGMGMLYNASTFFIDRHVRNGLGEKVAIYCHDEQITYSQLQTKVNKVGNMLKELGVEMENRVIINCHDTPEFVYSFFGSIKIGAVPIPVNTMMQPSDYEYFINNSRAKVLIIHEDLWDKIRHLRDRFIFLKHVIVIPENRAKIASDTINFYEMLNQAKSELSLAPTTRNDSAFWLFSSGSTGEPKGVIHLHHDMEVAFNTYARNVLQITEQDVCFSASKLFFAYGLGGGMYFSLGAGASTVLLPEKPLPEAVFETIEKYRPTIFFGVPTLYGKLIEYTEKNGKCYDLSSLRVCVSAGEALPEVFYRKWKSIYNVDILDGIGSTEALHIYISNRIDDIKEGSSGKLVPGFKAKIVNEDGAEVAPNQIGDLLISGDCVAHGYWNLHEENKRKFLGEWLVTGDKYYMDEEGYFWYCGRSDDMLKVGGIWISPIEIENCLLKHEMVLEVAVVGETKEEKLTVPKAYVVLKEDIQPSLQIESELKAFVKERLAHYKCPRIIEFVDELPKTASGKIQRFKLKVN
jgi:benzoate-CoA ligase family protein